MTSAAKDRRDLTTPIGGYGLGVEIQTLELDESRMSVWIPFADGNRRDAGGDLLEIGGIRLDRHQRNPIVLFDHGKQLPIPIAKAEDRDTGAYTVVLDAHAQTAKVNAFFYQGKGLPGVTAEREQSHAEFCEQLYDLIAQKYIRAGSIGYTVIQARPIPADQTIGIPAGNHLLSVMMLEASAVVLPMNQDTVRKMLALPKLCGRPLSPYLRKSLEPHLLDTGKVVTGYEKGLPPRVRKTKIPPPQWKPGVGAEKGVNYLTECPRDETGHCKPRGSSDTSGGEKKPAGKKPPARDVETRTGEARRKKPKQAKPTKTKKTVFKTRPKADKFARQVRSGGGKVIRVIREQGGGTAVFWYKHPKEQKPEEKSMADEVKNKAMPPKQQQGAAPPAPAPAPDEGDIPDDVMQDEVPEPDGETGGEDDVLTEKLSAQILRRMHDDALILLEDYDQFSGVLENERVLDFMQKKLDEIVNDIDAIEALFTQEHPDSDPIEGAMNNKAQGEEGEEGGEEIDDGEADSEEGPGDKVSSKESADAIDDDADDTAEETENEVEDGAENIEKKKRGQKSMDLGETHLKSLYMKYKGLIGCDCGKCAACKGEKSAKKVKPGDEEDQKKPGKEDGDPGGDGSDIPGGEENLKKPGADLKDPGGDGVDTPGDEEHHVGKNDTLAPHEKGMVKKAHAFLGELADSRDFAEEHRMQAYHHGANLKDISASRGWDDDEESEHKGYDDDSAGAGDEGEMSMPVGRPAWHKALSAAAGYFGQLCQEEAFGDSHRAEASEHQKALESFASDDDDRAPEADGGDHHADPGEIGHKSLDEIDDRIGSIDEALDRLLSLV